MDARETKKTRAFGEGVAAWWTGHDDYMKRLPHGGGLPEEGFDDNKYGLEANRYPEGSEESTFPESWKHQLRIDFRQAIVASPLVKPEEK